MATALIDLDAAPAAPDRRWAPHRLVLGVLGVVLLGLLGAAGPVRPPAPPTIIPGTFVDTTFVDGDRLFVVDPSLGDQMNTVRTYRLPDARLLGQITVSYPGDVTWVSHYGEVTLVSIGSPATTLGLDSATGRVRWMFVASVLGVADGLVLMTTAATETDGTDYAVDVRTGQIRWGVPEPAGGLLVATGLPPWASLGAWPPRPATAGLPRWLVTVTARGLIRAYDGRTGVAVGTARIAPLGGGFGYASGDLFVVGNAPAGLSSYTLPGLTARWHVPIDARAVGLQPDCVRPLCVYLGETGLAALDPASGRLLWSRDVGSTIEPYGSVLIEIGDQLAALDPATGDRLGDFGGWLPIYDSDGSTIRLVLHTGPVASSVLFGVLDPGRGSVRVLGGAADVSGHCDYGTGVVVYHRTDGSIAVWRLPVSRGGAS